MTGIEQRLASAGLSISLLLPLTGGAQAPLPAGVRGPDGVRSAGPGAMATRSVAQYLDQERTLAGALSRRDRAAAAALLADDFIVRTATSPDVDSADAWLKHELAAKPTGGQVRDLSVLELDDLAVVSFLLDRGRPGQPGASADFVVDVWRQSSKKLLSRSVTRAASAPARPTRPNGRE